MSLAWRSCSRCGVLFSSAADGMSHTPICPPCAQGLELERDFNGAPQEHSVSDSEPPTDRTSNRVSVGVPSLPGKPNGTARNQEAGVPTDSFKAARRRVSAVRRLSITLTAIAAFTAAAMTYGAFVGRGSTHFEGNESGDNTNQVAAQNSVPTRHGGDAANVEIAPGVRMTFCWVPPGTDMLGSPATEQGRQPEEVEHEYTCKGFWLGKYPVTQAEYAAVMNTNSSYFVPTTKEIKAAGINDTSRFPVESASWEEAAEFVKRLNNHSRPPEGLTDGKFCLPVEDEWEYACRGGSGNGRPFFFGTALDGRQANCDGREPYGTSAEGKYLRRTERVGSYEAQAPHPWGLCDMHGNVHQWCENWLDDVTRAVRGGGWDSYAQRCRSASRSGRSPTAHDEKIGFRVAIRNEHGSVQPNKTQLASATQPPLVPAEASSDGLTSGPSSPSPAPIADPVRKTNESPPPATSPAPPAERDLDRPKVQAGKPAPSVARRIVDDLLAVGSTKYSERGFAGFTFGDAYGDIKPNLKDGTAGYIDDHWLVTKDGAHLVFLKKKVVGVMKRFDLGARDAFDSLSERFGKADDNVVFRFDSVARPGGRSETGEQVLLRYGFPKCVVYGYVTSGDSSNFVGPYLLVSVFDREYLEKLLRHSAEQREKCLLAARTVADYVFGEDVKWDQIPFPKIAGTSASRAESGTSELGDNAASLEGRSAPCGYYAIAPAWKGTSAIFARELRAKGERTRVVIVSFNSFPDFDMHPLLGPLPGPFDVWQRSHGNWHLEHEAQCCNAQLAQQVFPPANDKVRRSTVANPLIRGMDGLAHKSFPMFTWETKDRLEVRVLGNNTIMIFRRDRNPLN